MSPNKRKIFASDTSDEDDSFKHQRRSSLRVNLSYSENQTDSGNGSLWKTEIENDKREADGIQTLRRLSRSKNTYEKNRQSDPDSKSTQAESDTKNATNNSETSTWVKEGIQLKRLTVDLEDISTKEQYLETRCKRLKDAILHKTKQIFDGDNELSVKTAMILGNRENRPASGTHNPNIRNKTVLLDITDRRLKEKATGEHEQCPDTSSDEREDQYSSIVPTPKSVGRRSLEKIVDKSRITQRRLFIEEDNQVEGQTKCRIIEDIVMKKSLPIFSLRQTNQNNSPILSGSNRRLSLFRPRSKLRLQNQFDNLNNTCSTVHSVQNIGMPVGCSTFIEDNAMADKGTSNEMDASHATHTTNKLISMEMTEIHGGIHMSKERMFLQNRNSDANNYNENSKKQKSEKSMQNKNASSLEDVEHPINKISTQNNSAHFNLPCKDNANNQDAASVHVDTIIPTQISIKKTAAVMKARNVLQAHECDNKTKRQNERRHTIFLSDSSTDTIRSSLNVNTSLDAVTEPSKGNHIRKSSIDYRTNNINQDFEANSKESVISKDQDKSTDTIRTSLEMNTSIDFMRHTCQKRRDKNDKNQNHSNMSIEYSSTENRKTNDADTLENISLIERLRNISMQNQISHNEKSRLSKLRNEGKRRSSNSGDSSSYVEGTPYPISRSVLFKSQLKHKTQHLDDAAACCSNLNSVEEEKNDKTKSITLHSEVPNETHMSTGTQKTIESNTVTLEDTPSCDPFIIQNQLTVIEETRNGTKSDESETDKNIAVQNAECVPVRKGRRKLMPLNEISQCSIIPIEKKMCTPEASTSTKRNKRLKKKVPRRKLMRSKNNTSNLEKNIASKQMWSDSDCDIAENKDKKNKKTRKPKKVISKKILIKKFADENVLNILQENKNNKEDHLTENGDSLDDFVNCRIISSQWNKHKSQKIVIVTTGLSKGDKSLVKSIVKSLGASELELNVSKRTTHVVSTGVRTVNLLRGIIRGCWLVTLEWVLKSLENNAWLDPETFEMKHFSKAVQENRKDRQLFGPSYIPELFTACGLIYIEHKTTVPYDTLKELIKTAGGHITENIKFAKIIVGANGLKETWVIDSITTGELQLTKLYQRERETKAK